MASSMDKQRVAEVLKNENFMLQLAREYMNDDDVRKLQASGSLKVQMQQRVHEPCGHVLLERGCDECFVRWQTYPTLQFNSRDAADVSRVDVESSSSSSSAARDCDDITTPHAPIDWTAHYKAPSSTASSAASSSSSSDSNASQWFNAAVDRRAATHAQMFDASRFTHDAVRIDSLDATTVGIVATRPCRASHLIFDEATLITETRDRGLVEFTSADDINLHIATLAKELAFAMLSRLLECGVRRSTLHDVWRLPQPDSPVVLGNDPHSRHRIGHLATSYKVDVMEVIAMLGLVVEHSRRTDSHISGIPCSEYISPMASKLQHSCAPNAIVLFSKQDRHVSVYALRDIRAGEAITCSFVPDVMLEDQYLQRRVDVALAHKIEQQQQRRAQQDAQGGAAVTKESPSSSLSASHVPEWKTEFMSVRALYVSERMHIVCACERCRSDERALEQRLSVGNTQVGISSLMVRLSFADVKVDIPDVTRDRFDNLYTHTQQHMVAMLRYGVINELVVGLAPMRLKIAQRFFDACPFFAWHESFEFLRAIVWGGGEVALHYNYEPSIEANVAEAKKRSAELLKHDGKMISCKSIGGTSKTAVRINAMMLRFTQRAVKTLLFHTQQTFRHSPAFPLARLLAFGMVACVYGMSPTMQHCSPLKYNTLQAMRDQPLVRVLLQAEQGRLFRKDVHVLAWYDQMMQKVAQEPALVAALTDATKKLHL